MLKKIILTTIITTSSCAFAATPYVGGSLGVTNLGENFHGTKATLFGGYGSTFGENKNIYLGGELNVDLVYYRNSQVTYGLGASLIPGIMLTKYTMAYARLGVEAGGYASRYSHHVSSELWTQIGIGLQTNITKNWDVRGEYGNRGLNFGLLYKFD